MAQGVTGMTRNGWKLPHPSRAVVMVLAWAAVGAAPAPGDPAVPQVAPDHAKKMALGLELFRKDVRALLTDHCLKCHGGASTKAEFDLTTREGLLRGGAERAGRRPGEGRGEPPLSARRPRRRAAHAPEGEEAARRGDRPDRRLDRRRGPLRRAARRQGRPPSARRTIGEEDRQFWSFRPLAKPGAAEGPGRGLVPHPRRSLRPGQARRPGARAGRPADRRTLIRRASFDLIGLPPTPEEVEAFVADPSPDAYEKLVDRLLASPHYGERWGRHWLDLARFAESHGYEQDYDRPYAYHYRDFVIQALNADMPYDRFVRSQLAGDELDPGRPARHDGHRLPGAGTHATQITANQVEKERYDELDDMTATVGTAFLGLTIGCARCHDHKFDPIPQARLLPDALDVHHGRPQRDRPRLRPGADPPREARVRPPARAAGRGPGRVRGEGAPRTPAPTAPRGGDDRVASMAGARPGPRPELDRAAPGCAPGGLPGHRPGME